MRVTVDIVIQSDAWAALASAEQIVRDAIATAADGLPGEGGEVSVALTDDPAVCELNRIWRGIDKPTNVLSFPATPPPRAGGEVPLGDIVVAYETVTREAAEEGKPVQHHLAHLAVHGFLHLIGFDHENDAQAQTMEDHERAVLARLSIPDPYAERGPQGPAAQHASRVE